MGNLADRSELCFKLAAYITSLKIKVGEKIKPVIHSANRRGFVGLRACLMNIPHMFACVRDVLADLKTYYLNQDHLELWFGVVRSHLGANNNPSTVEFRACFKKMLIYVDITDAQRGSNCQPLVALRILSAAAVVPINLVSLFYLNNIKYIKKLHLVVVVGLMCLCLQLRSILT